MRCRLFKIKNVDIVRKQTYPYSPDNSVVLESITVVAEK